MADYWWKRPESVDPHWQEFTGPGFELLLLEPRGRRLLRESLGWMEWRSVAYRITTADGRRYKLLLFPPGAVHKRVLTRNYTLAVGKIPLPRLHWQGKRSLVLEYVEGAKPDRSDRDFARQLGTQLGRLHGVGTGARSRVSCRAWLGMQLTHIAAARALSTREIADLGRVLHRLLPDSLPAALDLGDIKPANFVIDSKGELRMIDIGSLRTRGPKGQQVVGDKHFPFIDYASFRDGYQSVAQDDYMFTHLHALRLMQLTGKCAESAIAQLRGGKTAVRQRVAKTMESRRAKLRAELELCRDLA